MSRVVIVGNGVAGTTAARHIRKTSDLQITVIGSETEYFFSRTALMYIYMGHMRFEHTKPYEDSFWRKNRIELIYDHVTQIDPVKKEVHLEKGGDISYDKLILALGSQTLTFDWPGQDLAGVQGLYSLQDLELMERNTFSTRNAVIVGGGLIGVEMAEMLVSRGIHVTFIIREKAYWQNVLPMREAELIGRHIRKHGVTILADTHLEEIEDDGGGHVKGVLTSGGDHIPCDFVGLTTGVKPNIDLVAGGEIETGQGILVDKYLQTSVKDIYAVGDCAEVQEPKPGRRRIEPVWYVGRMMGETVARTITGDPMQYDPGVWFNSAKFFDLEYQTYGQVEFDADEKEGSFYWESENGNACLRVSYDPSDHRVTGINVIGIRLRHEVCDRWLSEGRSLQFVMDHLSEANFDPELYARFEGQVIAHFNSMQISSPTM